MNIAYIMRGVPGSGKSTLAKILVGENGIIHSTDDYFYENGVYKWDQSKLGEYRRLELLAFTESLKRGVPIVISDNVNMSIGRFTPYLDIARKHNYQTAVVTLPHPNPRIAARRNIHNVPEYVISDIIKRWQPY